VQPVPDVNGSETWSSYPATHIFRKWLSFQ
jgi:hypothetical protein